MVGPPLDDRINTASRSFRTQGKFPESFSCATRPPSCHTSAARCLLRCPGPSAVPTYYCAMVAAVSNEHRDRIEHATQEARAASGRLCQRNRFGRPAVPSMASFFPNGFHGVLVEWPCEETGEELPGGKQPASMHQRSRRGAGQLPDIASA